MVQFLMRRRVRIEVQILSDGVGGAPLLLSPGRYWIEEVGELADIAATRDGPVTSRMPITRLNAYLACHSIVYLAWW